MRLFINKAIRQATEEELQQVLNSQVFQQQISIWKPTDSGNGFYFAQNESLSYLVRHIIHPNLLHPELKGTVDKVISGGATKKELFGFCVATFKSDVNGVVRRLKHNYQTFTNLVQLDLDLKNEPDCTPEYVETVINDIYEFTDLGKHILFCGKSISRKGIYFYIQCDTKNTDKLEVVIAKVYQLLQKTFQFKNPDKTLDTSVTDIVNRLRYYSPDPDLVINPDVQPLNTSLITVKKQSYGNNYVSQAGSPFKELEIIRDAEIRFLKRYHHIKYISGFHSDFLRFANACIGRGVSKATLEKYTQQKFRQLYNEEKRMSYMPELMRVIDCAEKNILRK